MSSVWKWLKWGPAAAYILVAGALSAAGGHLIVDRRDMYGDDPANDPYSPDFDPSPRRDRRTNRGRPEH